MAVYRKRSTTRVPAALSISYLIGSPPMGTSTTTFTSCGGFVPIGMASKRMEGSGAEGLRCSTGRTEEQQGWEKGEGRWGEGEDAGAGIRGPWVRGRDVAS